MELGREQLEPAPDSVNVWLRRRWLNTAQIVDILGQLGEISDDFVVPSQSRNTDDFLHADTAVFESINRSQELDTAESINQTLTNSPSILSSARSSLEQPSATAVFQLPGLSKTRGAFDGEVTEASDDAAAHFHGFVHADTAILPARLLEPQPGSEPARHAAARYVLGHELGSGGGGRVVRAFDEVLGRTVAMKILHPAALVVPKTLARFVAEGQATGQLEHPNIVPIYDLGTLPSGELFYTMREVRRHTLREVLVGLKLNDAHYADEYTLVRLINILKQICQAVHYAHVSGVIHRDLKPSNIMIGDYGEVLVMDWGLARVLDRSVQTDLSRQGGELHEEGQTLGTPAYMPPEQARGELNDVDELSDTYSLGAILYEMLTLDAPFDGTTAIEIMWKVVDSELDLPSSRALAGRVVPEELERICMRAMHKEKEQRFSSAKELHDNLEDWIEGIQPREAARKVQAGAEAAHSYARSLEQIGELDEQVRRMATSIEDWEPIERKRELWTLEDQREQTQATSAHAFGEAVACFTQALAYQADNALARTGLADLCWQRFAQAEAHGDVADSIYFRALVEQYDATKYARQFEGNVNLRVFTEPEDARVTLFPFQEVDRRLVASDESTLGNSPLLAENLSIGSHLLVMEHPDHPTIRQPMFLERGRDLNLHIRLPHHDELQAGFVFVPGGECIIGGDRRAFDPMPSKRTFVASFFCARLPVTFGQYLQWVNALHEQDADEALRRAPQTRGSEGLLIRYDISLGEWVPDEILIEGPARKLYPVGKGHEAKLPVVGIRAEDAEAYGRWRGQIDGRPYRLPSAQEWEKASRGVDGRWFPWGNRFDATFCKMRFSRPDLPQLEPVGSFVDDTSPYGVRDMGGGVQEWCAEADAVIVDRPIKGGAWNQDARSCRLASRLDVLAAARTAGIGFRLVYSYDHISD
ncbi:MAG: SUMF1/EgtB/PvdO family nonheme iron enzyme [Bradymonadaceae bacterium]|nr:SUMF1/EgtB/PvdO family nonheme iron enzyme [Lujinxingiaceae bacterium]